MLNIDFAELEEKISNEELTFRNAIAKEAIKNYSNLDFPNNKDEEWRFTNISQLMKHDFRFISGSSDINRNDIKKFLLGEIFKYQFVFVNGKFIKELSSDVRTQNIEIVNIDTAIDNNTELFKKHFAKYAKSKVNYFSALNSTNINSGAFINITDNSVIKEPIHLLFISDFKRKTLVQPRNLFLAGKNSQATIIEHYAAFNDNIYFANAVTEIFVGENSTLNHIKIQEESRNSYHISETAIEMERSSNFESAAISFGGEISRNEINCKFNGQGCEATLNGLFMLDDTQLHDTHTSIDHAKPNCNSHEQYKGILDGKSRGVFNGKVIVRPNAQKTNAFQENNNIILSNEALVNTKPQLEIFADDVKCSHGATIGQIDQDSMFYLKSRGIGEETARKILIHAFASDVVKSIKVNGLKDYLENILELRFNKEK